MALSYMRRHKRWLYVFLWIVILAFVILYVPAFRGSTTGTPGEVVGRVGPLSITVAEFQNAYSERRQLYQSYFGGQRRLDDAALREMGVPNQVFQGLVLERLIDLEAKRLGVTVDDTAVAQALTRKPEFQRDGQFVGAAEVERRLQYMGKSIDDIEQELRRELIRQRLQAMVTDEATVSPAEVEREYRRRNEQVKVEYVLVDMARFRPQVAVTDAEVQARFSAQKEAYRVPEKRSVSYVLVDHEAMKAQVAVTDADIRTYYKENEDQFRQEEQVCAAHILIKVKANPEDKAGHDDAPAKQIAEDLLKQVKAGVDFAALAKKSSEDEGSKDKGGDLGCFQRGSFQPEFDNVVFELKAGEVSDPIRTAYGYQIVKVASRRDESLPPLNDVKENIRVRLLDQGAAVKAEEKAEALAQHLARGRSLEDAAKREGFGVQKTAPFARGETVEPLSSPVISARAFELKPGESAPEPFQVARGYAFIALSDVQPAHLPELNEVRDKVKQDLIESRALEQAKALALEVKSRAETAGLDKAAAALGLVRKETPAAVTRSQPFGDLGASALLDETAFSLAAKALSDPVRVETGYAVLRVLEKKAFDPAAFAKEQASLSASLRTQKQQQLFSAYLAGLRRQIPVERTEAFRRIVG